MSTKRSVKACKIPTGRKPTRRQYQFAEMESQDTMDFLSFAKPRGRKTKDALPPPHAWPAWGGACYQQAYAEMMATQTLAYTYMAYEAARRSGYMPATELAKYLAAYNLAKLQYGMAWGAMEDCLNLIV